MACIWAFSNKETGFKHIGHLNRADARPSGAVPLRHQGEDSPKQEGTVGLAVFNEEGKGGLNYTEESTPEATFAEVPHCKFGRGPITNSNFPPEVISEWAIHALSNGFPFSRAD